jgi:hypothetical protein
MSDATDWGRRQQAARERWIELDGYSVKVRRPTDLEMRRLLLGGEQVGEALALRWVIDWRGVTEQMVLPGVGGEDEVPFTPAAWEQFVGDRLADLGAVAQSLWNEFQARREERAALPGKSATS